MLSNGRVGARLDLAYRLDGFYAKIGEGSEEQYDKDPSHYPLPGELSRGQSQQQDQGRLPGAEVQHFANTLGRVHHSGMNAYSEDLRKKIVEAKERGMPTVEVARTFGVGLSSVKRYAKVARQGGSLRPKRSPGRRPKADERVRKLLEADLRERPAATLTQRRKYLRSVAGLGVSESTVSRLLRRMGWTRKKDRWEQANATSS